MSFGINSLVYVLRGQYQSRIGQVIGMSTTEVVLRFEENGAISAANVAVGDVIARDATNGAICEQISKFTDDAKLRAVLTACIYEGYFETELDAGSLTISPRRYGKAWQCNTVYELKQLRDFVDKQRRFAGFVGEMCPGTGTETALQAKYGGEHDAVNHPKHYNSHPSGIECIEITRHMGFNLGNAIKYIWRADLKNDAIEDLKKARWYLDDEIAKREKAAKP